MTTAKSTDERIRDALLAVTAKGLPLTHDIVAHEAQTSRRTVYRRYEDQAALRRAVWALLSPVGVMQGDLEWLLGAGLDETFGAFDDKAAAMIAAMASAEGRAIRNQKTADRVSYFRKIYAEALGDLAEPQRTQALSVLQLLSSGLAWREMRDQWGMDAPAMASTSRWALKTLLKALAEENAPDPA